VHLDIKPDNILCKFLTGPDGLKVETYKIGDFGLAVGASVASFDDNFTEGDCRYLAKELLQQHFGNLTSADVFSLGAMSYELASGRNLAMNGDEWHELRDKPLPAWPKNLLHLSRDMVTLIRSMMHPDSGMRPSCSKISANAVLDQGEHARVLREMRAVGKQRLLRHNSFD